MSLLRPVVLSGGSGTRLWPLSTPDLPKQFVPLFDGMSMFDLTLARLDGIEGVAPPIVVTGSSHVGLVEGAMLSRGIDRSQVLVEPEGRNTAPAAIAAALVADPDDVLVILPSDHLISDVEGFQRATRAAAEAAREGGIVTFGIQPSRPETGYGYIEIGPAAGEGVFEVLHFKEKPDLDSATTMVTDGRHVWNSGMFVATAGHLLAESAAHCPEMLEGVRSALPDADDAVLELGGAFRDIRSDSIDYAIMEKTDRAMVIPVDVGWDDVGSYRSLLDALPTDDSGNNISGDVIADDVTGSFLHAAGRKVAVVGMSDVVVVETPEAVLVIPLDRSQDVRELAQRVNDD